MMISQAPTAKEITIMDFNTLLNQMAELDFMPLDAREQFDAMLRENFIGMIND